MGDGVRPGWDLSTLKPGYHLGYGVDSGTGCFVDECAVARLPDGQPAFQEAFQRAHANLWAAYQAASQEAQGNPLETMRRMLTSPHRREWQDEMFRAYQAMVPPGLGEVLAVFDPDGVRKPARSAVLDPETAANIVCFPSGEGDGSYASYFGLVADGSAACLVTDFGMLVRSVMGTLEIPVPVQEHSELTHPGLADVGIDCIHVEWKPAKGEVSIHIGGEGYVSEVRFENRPGSEAVMTAASGGMSTWFRLEEPLQPTARVLIEYTLRTEAL